MRREEGREQEEEEEEEGEGEEDQNQGMYSSYDQVCFDFLGLCFGEWSSFV